MNQSLSDVQKLFGKILLLLLPFCILFALYTQDSPSATQMQQGVLEDKIQRLVLPSHENLPVIIAGESRAELSIIPDLFMQETKMNTVNAAVGLATLPQIYDAFERHGLLKEKRLIAISVSSYEINDTVFTAKPVDVQIMLQEPLGLRKIQMFTNYYTYLTQFYFNHFKDFLRADIANHSLMDEATFARKGYVPGTGVLVATAPGTKDDHNPWYVDAKTDGLKKLEFLRAIDGLGKSKSTILIFEGPIAPQWRDQLRETNGPSIEDNFISVIRDAITRYPNIHFIDFRTANIPELPNDAFSDNVHLNANGAALFTHIFVKRLRSEGFLP